MNSYWRRVNCKSPHLPLGMSAPKDLPLKAAFFPRAKKTPEGAPWLA